MSDHPEAKPVPLVEEGLQVGKRTVETGRTTIRKRVHERQEEVDLPLWQEQVEVRRVAVNRIVESAPATRVERGVTIIPVLEEVLVKQLMLREELHIERSRVEVREPQRVKLRREEIETSFNPAK